MYNKTWISALGWLLSVGGWFLWTLLLSAVYKHGGGWYLLYPIRDSFITHFGQNLLWWFSLFLTLAAVILFEIGVSSARKTFWPTDTDLFQELQKDRIIRERFEETIRREAEGGGEVEMGKEKEKEKNSSEAKREGEIQELLNRPRVMGGDGTAIMDDAEVVRSPVDIRTVDGMIESAGGSLKQRKFSMDTSAIAVQAGETIEMTPTRKPTRHSIDIAELLRRGSRS